MEHQDFRGYAGRIDGGVFKPGDRVRVLPSGFSTTIKTIEIKGKPLEEAFAPMSVTMTLNDEIDISRGDMIVRENNQPEVGQDIEAMVCWMNSKPLNPRTKVVVRHTTKECVGMVKEILYKMDINTLHRIEGVQQLGMNDIGRVTIRSAQPLLYDAYRRNRQTGSIILVDEQTNETVAAGMILS
jgi:sulfate adenylyltransferase subunit 1